MSGDDTDILARVPANLLELVRSGSVAFRGGLHIRGACRDPQWHSLRAAWEGTQAFHELYPAVLPSDVPFGEDCMGDQFLLREGVVFRLAAETGALEEVASSVEEFLADVEADAVETLQMHPLLQFEAEVGRLHPGQLLSAMPPFCMAESGEGVSLRAISANERRSFLASLAKQLEDVPDGGTVTFELSPPEKGRRTTK